MESVKYFLETTRTFLWLSSMDSTTILHGRALRPPGQARRVPRPRLPVWRRPPAAGCHLFVEWSVAVSVVSDCFPLYTSDDNSAILATDSIKNTVYVKAKECTDVVSMEEFAVIPGRHFTSLYPLVVKGLRGYSDHRGAPMGACGCRRESPFAWVQTWCRKARHRGHCEEVWNPAYKFWNPRILTANYNSGILLNIFPSSHQSQFCFTQRYLDVKKVLADTFLVLLMFGVYSPSVQNTLYLMAKEVLTRLPDIASVQLRMPNLHFLPVNLSSKENPGLVKFADDVHMSTDEPHGTIEATLSRANSKL